MEDPAGYMNVLRMYKNKFEELLALITQEVVIVY